MIHLCYVSTASRLMSQSELLELLAEARAQNIQTDITGMLLYKDMSFLQVLEGAAENVHRTFENIRSDERHERVQVLFDEPIDSREFPDWAMGFENLDGDDLTTMPGYSAFMVDGKQARESFDNIGRAKKILFYFRAKS